VIFVSSWWIGLPRRAEPRARVRLYARLVRENDLLRHIFATASALHGAYPRVLVGPGDDCAVIATHAAPDAPQLLLKVDQVVEGVHFTRETPLHMIARKAIARALSDIAAMAGTPLAALAGAVLPRNYAHSRELADALHTRAHAFRVPIVGGDVASADAPLTISISILGLPHAGRGPVLRSAARPGDHVYVTGELGGSFHREPTPDFPFPGGGRHLTFPPRLDEARALADALGPDLHAMMDTSDGLGIDAGRLALASRVAIELDEASLPLAPGASPSNALADGEDYELLFTSPRELPPDLLATRLTRIGRVIKGPAGACTLRTRAGAAIDAATQGWQHR
jgi:thiamine-monophosphate kinase